MCLFPLHIKGNTVPCGKCAQCLKDRVEGWKFRFSEESKNWRTTAFITLTVDEENANPNGVDKHAVQCFLKRLRHKIQFKYYLISEYGPNTFRQHYHMIIFSDLVPDKLYDTLECTWDKGIVTYGDVNIKRITYVANFHVTKGFHPKDKNPNFVLSSQRLGRDYLSPDIIHYYRETGNMYARCSDGYKIPLPRYFKDKVVFSTEKKEQNKARTQRLISSENAEEELQRLARLKRWNNKILKRIKQKKNHI